MGALGPRSASFPVLLGADTVRHEASAIAHEARHLARWPRRLAPHLLQPLPEGHGRGDRFITLGRKDSSVAMPRGRAGPPDIPNPQFYVKTHLSYYITPLSHFNFP